MCSLHLILKYFINHSFESGFKLKKINFDIKHNSSCSTSDLFLKYLQKIALLKTEVACLILVKFTDIA